MSYASEQAAISHIPNTIVRITLDYCNNTFGSSPCTATATAALKCFNTYATCKDKANFSKGSKVYKFSLSAVPIEVTGLLGVRPYIDNIQYLSTEITDNLTKSGTCSVTFRDEPDGDIGIDPYYSDRTNRNQGTFWKKLIARNPNYVGRRVEILEGFAPLAEADYVQKWEGIIDTIAFNSDGMVTMEIGDLLTGLEDIEIPTKTDAALSVDITADATVIPLNTALHGLTATGYIRIDDEIIYYDGYTNSQIDTGVLRGQLGTTAAEHTQNTTIQQVRYFGEDSGYDHLQTMALTDAAIASGFVDSTAFDLIKTMETWSVQFRAIISEPISLRTIFFELVDLQDCKCWVGEDNKITIAKNLPNFPGRSYTEITDENNIEIASGSVDMNNNLTLDPLETRITMYWDKLAVGQDDDPSSYKLKRTRSNSEAESENMFNKIKEKVIFCRWLQASYMDEDLMERYIDNLLDRRLRLYKNPMPIYVFTVEIKDGEVHTGKFIKVTTNKITDIYGAGIVKHVFQITKRQVLDNNRIELTALKYPRNKIGFIAANTVPEYTSATEAEKESAFISGSDNLMSDGTEGYYIY